MLNPRRLEFDAPCELLDAIPREPPCEKLKLWGKCKGPAVTCDGLDRMWSMPWGFAPWELLLLLVAPKGLRVKPERSTCKLVRSSKTSASLFSCWWCKCSWARCPWCAWCFISVIECRAANGAASMFRWCSMLRKLRFCWLANSSILETGGGGVTDTSERSLDASLCCVIAAGDGEAVVAAMDATAAPCSSCVEACHRTSHKPLHHFGHQKNDWWILN